MWETEEEMMAELIREGCITDTYYDENADERMVAWNWEALQAKFPEVYEVAQEQHMAEVQSALDNLAEQGLIEVSFTETDDGLVEVYRPTERGKAYIEGLVEEEPEQ